MWTENVSWFSNEEGRKGQIAVGQLGDLIVPDRDFFACAESEIGDIVSNLTVVGGRIVYAAGDFKGLDDTRPPPAMPDWSPVRTFGGYGNWANGGAKTPELPALAMRGCGDGNHRAVRGHDHAHAWSVRTPASDLKSFWGALGCSCWEF
jgi:hypothetical protein